MEGNGARHKETVQPLSEFIFMDHSLESRQITWGKSHVQTCLVLIMYSYYTLCAFETLCWKKKEKTTKEKETSINVIQCEDKTQGWEGGDGVV